MRWCKPGSFSLCTVALAGNSYNVSQSPSEPPFENFPGILPDLPEPIRAGGQVAPRDGEHRLAPVEDLEEGHPRRIGPPLPSVEVREPGRVLRGSRGEGHHDEAVQRGDDEIGEGVLRGEAPDALLDIRAVPQDLPAGDRRGFHRRDGRYGRG